jgi:hypothetical protein
MARRTETFEREIAPVHHVAQRDRGQKAIDMPPQRRPQLMGDALFAADAAVDGIAGAAGDPQRLVDRQMIRKSGMLSGSRASL